MWTRPSEQVLRDKENESLYLIREATCCCRRPAVLWSIGKDSTAMLHMVRKAFLGCVPMPVIHIDTGNKFPEMYRFRDLWARRWGLELIVARNDAALAAGVHCGMDHDLTCCHQLKTLALRQVVERHGFDGLLVGIRRDEHGVRAKERHFSPRGSDFRWEYARQAVEVPGVSSWLAQEGAHVRVHPLLQWSELEVWCYTSLERLPVNELYLARGGLRYRSLGCRGACKPVASSADSVERIIGELMCSEHAERAGRLQDKESAERMQRLRSLGYM